MPINIVSGILWHVVQKGCGALSGGVNTGA